VAAASTTFRHCDRRKVSFGEVLLFIIFICLLRRFFLFKFEVVGWAYFSEAMVIVFDDFDSTSYKRSSERERKGEDGPSMYKIFLGFELRVMLFTAL